MSSQKEEFSGNTDSAKDGLKSHDTDIIYVSDQKMPASQVDDDNIKQSAKKCEINGASGNVNGIEYDFPNHCETPGEGNTERTVKKHINTLEEGLYDVDVAEIYLGEESIDKVKSSEGSDSNLSEMTNSFEPLEDIDIDMQTRGMSPKTNQELLPSGINNAPSSDGRFELDRYKTINQIVCGTESRKRPLSPNDFTENSSESKRVKSEPVTFFDHSLDTNTNKCNNGEDVIDLCPPVAIVAPLGFCEDIFIDDTVSAKYTNDEPSSVKNDISSILDSLDQEDDKSLSLFDSVFEKMKTDIMDEQSFKTLGEGKWTFEGKPSKNNEIISKPINVDSDKNKNEKQNPLTNAYETSRKPDFKRATSVEHDIEDFEKVLNSVIAKATRLPKENEGIVQKFNSSLPVSGMKSSVHNKQCKQPCNHVSNSDLLRELLDQKTETNDTQTKTRHEIDLSFLHSDLISGKGLTVSSDKILQTRTIDPRLTSIPHVERVSNINQTIPGNDMRESNQSANHKSNAARLLEGDHISLAEQRRASVTLHHKVPPHDFQQNHSHQRNIFNDVNGECSNIIKEAFDFATEISDLTNDEGDSVLPQPPVSVPFGSRQQMLTNSACHSSPQNESYINRNNFNQSLKIDPMQNHQMIRNSRMPEMQSGNGLLTFANPNAVQTSDANIPPQLAGPFMNSPENPLARSHDIRQQQDPNQRAAMYAKRMENLPPHGNRLIPANSEMQSHKGTFEHMQNPNMVHANPMKQLPMGPMDPLRNTSIAQRHNQTYMSHNVPAGYPTSVASRANPRSNMTDIGLHSQEKVPNYRYDSGMPMNHMNRAMIQSENNYPMGMQERIRAMNVQQWYRRRMQAQMNRQMNPQSEMTRQPFSQSQGMGSHMMAHGQGAGLHTNTQGHGLRMRQRPVYPGNVPNSQMILPDQNVESRLRVMQSQIGHMNTANTGDNQRLQQHAFPQGQDQINFDSQNLRHTQYGQQLNQQNKVADSEAVNPMYMSRPFSADGVVDSTKGSTATLGDISQHFDVKREPFSSQSVQDMFPFNI